MAHRAALLGELNFSFSILILTNFKLTSAVKDYQVMRDFDLSLVNINDSLAVSDASSVGDCGETCSIRDDCVTAIFDERNSKCYLWSYLIDQKKLADSGGWLLHTMCPEKQAQVCCEYQTGPCGGPVYKDCQDAFEKGDIRNGDIYYLRPDEPWNQTIRAVCEFDSFSGWTIFQRRLDGSVDFYRYWKDYVDGFGTLRGEYWIGLEALHYLTNANRKASFYLEDHDGEVRTANYSGFHINPSGSNYTLNYDSFSGDAGNSLARHLRESFTTRDVDNDDRSGENCAINHVGAWWYDSCQYCNLNGKWIPGGDTPEEGKGITWNHWKGNNYSLKVTKLRLSR